MRIVRDVVGDVDNNLGARLHTNVRAMTNDQGAVAVFEGRSEPVAVYSADDVTVTITRKPCACKGDPAKMALMRLWERAGVDAHS